MSTRSEQNAAAHSPAPFHVRERGERLQIVDANDNILARLDPWKGKAQPEMDANAELFAAAPDLLAACAKMLARWDALSVDNLGQGCHAIAEQARAAIKKAATQ